MNVYIKYELHHNSISVPPGRGLSNNGLMIRMIIIIMIITTVILIVMIIELMIIIIIMIVIVLMIIIILVIIKLVIIMMIILIVNDLWKGSNGVSTNGVAANFTFFDRGTFWVLLFTYVYLPKSARAYLFPQPIEIHYFCSGPISVDPICAGFTTISTTYTSKAVQT